MYLLSSDNYFTERGIPYFRYSDDILILADSPEELLSYRETATKFIEEKGLSLNPDKLSVTNPGEAFEFLGFSIQGTDCPEKRMPGGKVDLSEAALRKMKNKIKRKAHLLYRRQKNNGKNTPLTFEESARILLKTFNRKYFDEAEEDRFTWSRWFFPVLTCTDGLAKLDAYLLSYVRFLKPVVTTRATTGCAMRKSRRWATAVWCTNITSGKIPPGNLSFPAKYTMIEKTSGFSRTYFS